jgi:hypothetical protein
MSVWEVLPNCPHSRCGHDSISDPVCGPNEEILNMFFMNGIHLL